MDKLLLLGLALIGAGLGLILRPTESPVRVPTRKPRSHRVEPQDPPAAEEPEMSTEPTPSAPEPEPEPTPAPNETEVS